MPVTASPVQVCPGPQTFAVDIGLVSYRMRLTYADAPEGGWLLDLSDVEETPIVCGIPLLPKQDLLAQYAYLGLGFGLAIVNTEAPDDPPTFDGLGRTCDLYVLQAA